jgi:hypothetical protein
MIAPPDGFPAWMAFYNVSAAQSDLDGDGLSALVEYALGTDPTRSADLDGAAGLPRVALGADGHLELQFQTPENLGATQLHGPTDLSYAVEASDDLVTWSTIAVKTFAAAWSGLATVTVGNANAGKVPVTVRDTASTGRRFLRLRANLSP